MVTIYIDGKPYETEAGDNLLKTCIKLGIDIPYFCYHPALGSVGSCRLCAVKRYRDNNDTRGRIVMSCMEPVTDGMIVSVNDEEVKNFRASVIESLMTNHPHDCPICDEGGECHLQDMVVRSGHVYRRFEFNKRTFKNQYLGPYIHHEMNRCIQCYRCVRFYRDYAGGKDFGVFGAHNKLYFGRFEDGQLESDFSGNLIEVCPTGVFTDKTLRKHYTRKWDLTNAPSVCTHCSVGCNIIISERYGTMRRVLNRYNDEVNGYFICDRGRFGYEFINDEFKRIRSSKYNNSEISFEQALKTFKQFITRGKTIGIGSGTASVEANYLLRKLVGIDNFVAGIDQKQFSLIKSIINHYNNGRNNVFSLKQIEQCEGVLILGEDISITAPRLALTVRQTVKNKPLAKARQLNIPEWHDAAVKTVIGNDKGPLCIASLQSTKIDDVASVLYHSSVEDIEKLAIAIENLLTNQSITSFDDNIKTTAKNIVESLLACSSVAIISGTQPGSQVLIEKAANIAAILKEKGKQAGIYMVVPQANSLGLGILANKSFEEIDYSDVETVIVLENDTILESEKANHIFTGNKKIVAIHHSANGVTEKSTLVLASTTFAEAEGTLISSEGRMQRYFSVMPPKDETIPSWKWLALALDNSVDKPLLQNIIDEIAGSETLLAKIKEAAPDSNYRINGMKIPRQTPRFSGRTSMLAHVNVHEPKPVDDENSPLAYSMEGTRLTNDAAVTTFYLMPGWNSTQASNRILRDLDNVVKARSAGVRIWE